MAYKKQNGVTDVVSLPDGETNWLYLLMKADPSLRLIGVTREGHACSIAVGGRRPLILIQNTRLMESGDSLRGWLLVKNVPVLLMVGYRGWTRHGINQDSAATYTEQFLNAFDLTYYLVESDADRLAQPLADPRANLRRLQGGARGGECADRPAYAWQARTRDQVLPDLRAELE